MFSKEFQAAHDSIYNLGKRFSEYLQEIRQAKLSKGDDTKGLQSVEDDINKALTELKENKYQVAVIAAMKAGKSTFLNAIIGADVLASETAACTICRTDVRHISNLEDARLLEYREGQKRPFEIAKGDAGEIQHKFLVRTREIREKGNPDNIIRFEIEHPIEAISSLSSLSGFTLVDTPGPNEWESANFNTVALKQTALEALRTCNVILFVLNYASYKDNAVSDLFKDIVENRKEILAKNTGKIFFILNKVDQKTERDREIDEVIKDLKQELSNFGFPNPIIYPASSRQGLLAKLIAQEKASENQIKDFKKFFSSRYAIEDEEGNQIIPAPRKIASQALADSGIPMIQETVIQVICQNSGWNLLSDALASLEKSAKAIEDSLNTQISGWEMGIEELKEKIEDYRRISEIAKGKVETVKKSVEQQKHLLVQGFNNGVTIFADQAKEIIQNEIDGYAQSRTNKPLQRNEHNQASQIKQKLDWFSFAGEIGINLLEIIPGIGKGFAEVAKTVLKTRSSLRDDISKSTNEVLNVSIDNLDPYIIRVNSNAEANKIRGTINDFCAPHIQGWWLDTQDQLIREGTQIREALVLKIQEDIQQISNEISKYLGESLQVKLNINEIQFPKFDFKGIDASVKHQQEVIKRSKKVDKRRERCCDSDEVYQEDEEYEDKLDFYEIDLRQTVNKIKQKIDEQVSRNQHLLERVIENQISKDFRNAENQINNYIKRFQNEFDFLLIERETKQTEADKIRVTLNLKKDILSKYLYELNDIRTSLNQWKPN